MTYYNYKTDNVYDIDTRLKDVKYRVEASSFETMHYTVKYDLKQSNVGLFLTVGHFHGEPITISISFSEWLGQSFIFWCAESNTVKYDVIEEWFENNLKHLPTHNKTNTMNFSHCLHELERIRDNGGKIIKYFSP